MADAGLFIGWGNAVRGRERQSLTVFNEAVEMWSKLQAEGEIETWEAAFLEPHGGDLQGFFLLRGDRSALARIRASDEMAQLTLRAGLIVEGFGVVGADLGERIQQQMAAWTGAVDELT